MINDSDVQVTSQGIEVQPLVGLALRGLAQMFNFEGGLFCYRLKRTERGLAQEGISRRYSVIALLGLHHLEAAGTPSPIPIEPVLERLCKDLNWIDNIGDLGLLLWLCALAAPQQLYSISKQVDLEDTLARYEDARQVRTMETAWFLAGLSHWALCIPEARTQIENVALATYRRLHANRAACGVFSHMAREGSLAGRLRWWMGSFADQVYPIYAITKFAQAWPNPGAQRIALESGRAICEAQGPLGQWWWHYDAANGGTVEIIDAYPVFSVHQHGMAPMVLFEVGEAFQEDFTPWIYKGLSWIHGQNELGLDMEDDPVIWRCIERPSSLRRNWESVFNRKACGRPREARELRVRCECRPYELGWLLYAWAGRSGYPQR